MTDIISQIVDVYHKFETWHKSKLSVIESFKYHDRLIMQGNIVTVVKDSELKGYLEIWRVNFEQFGRLVCDVPFYVYDENITNGKIAYIANMWIEPGYRGFIKNNVLFEMFIEKFGDCEFVAGCKTNRNSINRVYSMQQIKGVKNGSRKEYI